MDKKQLPEVVKFLITNEGAPSGSLKDFDRDMEAFRRTIESSTNSLVYFQDAMKKITTQGSEAGLGSRAFYVNKEDAANVMNALSSKAAQMQTSLGNNWQYDVTMKDAPMVRGNMTIVGNEAFKTLQAEAHRIGGEVHRNPTKKNPDRVSYAYPTEDLTLLEPGNRHKTDVFKGAKKLSREADEVRKEHERALEVKETEKRKLESIRSIKSAAKAILTMATVAVDLLRRLVTAALSQAVTINKEANQAHTLGMTYMGSRGMSLFDKAHGLAEGTSMGAVQSIQNMFGDITNLDEQAISTLARVMGGDIEALVKSGMGGSSPDVLMEKILDRYFDQFLQGKNSLGQTVGQNAAIRELTTSLSGVSEELGALFAKMANDYMSGSYGRFGSYAEWRRTTNTNRTGLTDLDAMYADEIAKKYQEVLAMFDDLKTSFLTQLAGKLDGLLTALSNTRIGMSANESIKTDEKNRALNEVFNAELSKGISETSSMIEGSAAWQEKAWTFGDMSLDQIVEIGISSVKPNFIPKGKYTKDQLEQGKRFFGRLLGTDMFELVTMLAAQKYYKESVVNPELAKGPSEDVDNVALNSVGMLHLAKELYSAFNNPYISDLDVESIWAAQGVKNKALGAYLGSSASGDTVGWLEFLLGVSDNKDLNWRNKGDAKKILESIKGKPALKKEMAERLAQAKTREEKVGIISEIAGEAWANKYPKEAEKFEQAAFENMLGEVGSGADAAVYEIIKQLNPDLLSGLGDGKILFNAQEKEGGYIITLKYADENGTKDLQSFSTREQLGKESHGEIGISDGGMTYFNAGGQ